MNDISAADVKSLRDRTGAGVLACREALTESAGDVERAVEILRTRGQAQAAKRAGEEAREGVVQSYIHSGKPIEELRGELASETRENIVIRRFARFAVGA